MIIKHDGPATLDAVEQLFEDVFRLKGRVLSCATAARSIVDGMTDARRLNAWSVEIHGIPLMSDDSHPGEIRFWFEPAPVSSFPFSRAPNTEPDAILVIR